MMAPMELRVQRVAAPVRQQVYEQLKRAIVGNHFDVGQRLTERELTELLGVSRPTIREALQQLVAEDLVTMVPGKGWVVASLSPEQARDLYDVRALLEGLAARRFAERATLEDVEDLKAALRNIEATLTTSDVTRRVEAKDVFYDVLLRGARSEVIVALITTLHARISAMRARTLMQPGRPAQTITELRTIVQHIVDKDADAAERASVEHVRMAAQTLFGSAAEPQRQAD